MRSRSISPSTSIKSYCSGNSDSDDSGDDTSRYAGLTEEELNEIWERRNLAYFDRRQRLLAEERERQRLQPQQQQQNVNDDDLMDSSIDSDSNSVGEEVQRDAHQRLVRPAGYRCAADDPRWRDMTSRNIMGEYDPERASREPAYRNAWISCQRLVNLNRSGVTSGGFVPSNPRLAEMMEQRRREVAQERHELEVARRQQQQQQQQFQAEAVLPPYAYASAAASSSQQEQVPSFATCTAAVQQAAEYDRLNQAHLLQQYESSHAAAQGGGYKSSSSEQSSPGEGKSAPPTSAYYTPTVENSYYMALPYPTQYLTKPVTCPRCNVLLYTSQFAKRFYCQTCCSVAAVPFQNEEARLEEKMQDVEDADYAAMTY